MKAPQNERVLQIISRGMSSGAPHDLKMRVNLVQNLRLNIGWGGDVLDSVEAAIIHLSDFVLIKNKPARDILDKRMVMVIDDLMSTLDDAIGLQRISSPKTREEMRQTLGRVKSYALRLIEEIDEELAKVSRNAEIGLAYAERVLGPVEAAQVEMAPLTDTETHRISSFDDMRHLSKIMFDKNAPTILTQTFIEHHEGPLNKNGAGDAKDEMMAMVNLRIDTRVQNDYNEAVSEWGALCGLVQARMNRDHIQRDIRIRGDGCVIRFPVPGYVRGAVNNRISPMVFWEDMENKHNVVGEMRLKAGEWVKVFSTSQATPTKFFVYAQSDCTIQGNFHIEQDWDVSEKLIISELTKKGRDNGFLDIFYVNEGLLNQIVKKGKAGFRTNFDKTGNFIQVCDDKYAGAFEVEAFNHKRPYHLREPFYTDKIKQLFSEIRKGFLASPIRGKGKNTVLRFGTDDYLREVIINGRASKYLEHLLLNKPFKPEACGLGCGVSGQNTRMFSIALTDDEPTHSRVSAKDLMTRVAAYQSKKFNMSFMLKTEHEDRPGNGQHTMISVERGDRRGNVFVIGEKLDETKRALAIIALTSRLVTDQKADDAHDAQFIIRVSSTEKPFDHPTLQDFQRKMGVVETPKSHVRQIEEERFEVPLLSLDNDEQNTIDESLRVPLPRRQAPSTPQVW